MRTSTENFLPWVITAFRIVIGLLFFCHGTSTLFGWPTEPHGGAVPAIMAWPSWWAALIQIVVGALVMVGLATRSAAFIGAGSMAVAYFWKHQGDGLWPIENGGESSALFCWALLILVFLGPGQLAAEALLNRSRRSAAVTDDAVASTPEVVRS